MYKVVRANSYKRDFRLAVKQGKDITELERAIDILAGGGKLPAEYRDHPLKGKYIGYRECHIEDDWLLIYKKDNGLLILLLSRTGSHQELFD